MLVQLLVTFLLSVKFSLGTLEDPDAKCQNVYTYGYGYHKFYNLPQSSFQNGKIVFNFSIAATSNGHVLFSESNNVFYAYEVVLGAGGNEFSEIRKYNHKKMEPKTHLMTKNIISQMQPKNFSVTIKDSIVSVYYMNNNRWYLLMAWEDSSPLLVKYISFSSWTGVSGKWLFDCKGASAVPESVTPLKKLRKQLLTNYDPYAVPASDIDKLTIDASIELQYISLDAKKSILTTHGKFYFTWFDPKLQWNPIDFGNLSSITLLHREIWLPDFILYNSEDDGSSPMERAVIRINNKGTVSWSPEAKLTTWCGLDLKNWPFDDHTCNVSLGLHSHPDHVSVSLSSKNVKPELILKDLEWKIVSLIGKTSTIVNPWDYNEANEVPKAFTITIRLKRQVEMHLYAFVLPTFVCIFIILSCFWMPIFVSKRLYLHSACLFLLFLNLIAVDRALPALPSSTPYLLTVNSNLLLLTVVHIIFCCYIINKVEFHEEYVSKFLDRIVSHPLVHSWFCILGESQYYHMKDESQLNADNKLNQWALFGIILDRILFLFTIIYISIILIV